MLVDCVIAQHVPNVGRLVEFDRVTVVLDEEYPVLSKSSRVQVELLAKTLMRAGRIQSGYYLMAFVPRGRQFSPENVLDEECCVV